MPHLQRSRIWSIGLCIKRIHIRRRLSSSLQLKLGFYFSFLSIYTMEELSFVVHSTICKFFHFPIFLILGLRWLCLIFCFPWTEMEVVFTGFYCYITSDFASWTLDDILDLWTLSKQNGVASLMINTTSVELLGDEFMPLNCDFLDDILGRHGQTSNKSPIVLMQNDACFEDTELSNLCNNGSPLQWEINLKDMAGLGKFW